MPVGADVASDSVFGGAPHYLNEMKISLALFIMLFVWPLPTVPAQSISNRFGMPDIRSRITNSNRFGPGHPDLGSQMTNGAVRTPTSTNGWPPVPSFTHRPAWNGSFQPRPPMPESKNLTPQSGTIPVSQLDKRSLHTDFIGFGAVGIILSLYLIWALWSGVVIPFPHRGQGNLTVRRNEDAFGYWFAMALYFSFYLLLAFTSIVSAMLSR